jgi:hypothetical protein
MQSFTAGAANRVIADIVAKADGSPIVSGTVNFYLRAKTGDNVDKWFQTSDSTWQATEQIAGVASHVSDGHWQCEIIAAAWEAGVRYVLYAKEAGGLHISYCEEVTEGDSTNITVETTVIE